MPDKPPRKSNLPDWARPGPQGREASAAPPWSMVVNRSQALAGGAALALLLAIAFAAGRLAAQKSTTRELTAKHKAEIDGILKNMAPLQAGPAVEAPRVPVTEAPQPAPQNAGDPRRPGLNYPRLCQVPVAEAEKMVAFLAAKGQRTVRVPVAKAPHLVSIYATNQGFKSSGEIEYEKFRAEVLSFGDKWAKQNKGANPFRSMFLEKYGK